MPQSTTHSHNEPALHTLFTTKCTHTPEQLEEPHVGAGHLRELYSSS